MIEFRDLKDGINIFIPKDLLKFVAENHPEEPLIVHNVDDLQTYVLEQIKEGLGDPDTGCTDFQTLLDKAIQEVASNGEECVDFKEII